MFTGLIEKQGHIQQIKSNVLGKSFVIRTDPTFVSELTLGESVAVNGACLTVTQYSGNQFEVDASQETLDKTTLNAQKIGHAVHLERALKLGARLGGHWVTGHIDGIGHLKSIKKLGEALNLTITAPQAQMKYIVTKGSIAIDGVSLTVNEVTQDEFTVVLIPHTQSVIQLHQKAVMSPVNLETDIIGKYIEKLMLPRFAQQGTEELASKSSKLDMEMLSKYGFIK
jgi:riboflavin synthase